MSRCLDSEHPRQASKDGHSSIEGYLEAHSLGEEDIHVEPGGDDTGWDVLGIQQGVSLEWSVWRAMVLEDLLRVAWILLGGVIMWLVSKYTIPYRLDTPQVLGEWDFGWRQYVSWYWGVWVALIGGLWCREWLL